MRTPTELYEYLEQNKENITKEEWQDIFKEMLKMLFEDEYKKMVIDVFENIKAEIQAKADSIPWRNTLYQDGQIEALEDVIELIDKHIGKENE